MAKEKLPKRRSSITTASHKPAVKAAAKIYHWPSSADYPPVTLNRLTAQVTLLREGFVKGYEIRQPEIDRLEKRIKFLEKQIKSEHEAHLSHSFGD